jgi:hypothetical protein
MEYSKMDYCLKIVASSHFPSSSNCLTNSIKKRLMAPPMALSSVALSRESPIRSRHGISESFDNNSKMDYSKKEYAGPFGKAPSGKDGCLVAEGAKMPA